MIITCRIVSWAARHYEDVKEIYEDLHEAPTTMVQASDRFLAGGNSTKPATLMRLT